MGYFGSGSDLQDYESRYCSKCLHDRGEHPCAVMAAHWNCASDKEANFRGSSPEERILDTLIPRLGGINQECKMLMQIPAHLDVDWDKVMADYLKDIIARQEPDDIEVIREPTTPTPQTCEPDCSR